MVDETPPLRGLLASNACCCCLALCCWTMFMGVATGRPLAATRAARPRLPLDCWPEAGARVVVVVGA